MSGLEMEVVVGGEDVLPAAPTVRLFGYDVLRAERHTVVDHLVQLAALDRVSYVATMNVDHVVELAANERFRRAYRQAAVVVPDGAPVVAVAKLAGRTLPARVTGAELLPLLCERAVDSGLSVAIVGGADDVNSTAVARLREQHPGLVVHGFSPYGFDTDDAVSVDMARQLHELQPRITFLCFGAPRSEMWVAEHAHLLPPSLVVCAGAAVDFAAGTKRRAPRWMQRFGLEWLYRLYLEPGRLWKRYLVRDMAFIPVAVREVWNARRGRGADA